MKERQSGVHSDSYWSILSIRGLEGCMERTDYSYLGEMAVVGSPETAEIAAMGREALAVRETKEQFLT
jgi:hypothetical protein